MIRKHGFEIMLTIFQSVLINVKLKKLIAMHFILSHKYCLAIGLFCFNSVKALL